MSSWSRGTSVSQSGSGPMWQSTGFIIDNDANTFTYVTFTTSGTSQTLSVTGFNSLNPFSATATPIVSIRAARTGTSAAQLYARLRIDSYTYLWRQFVLSETTRDYTLVEQATTSADWRNAIVDFYAQSFGMVQANAYDLTLYLIVRGAPPRQARPVHREAIFEAAHSRPPHVASKKVPILGLQSLYAVIPSRAVLWREEPPEDIAW